MKFYRCNHCGNLFLTLNDGAVIPQCCGEAMSLLKPGTSDGATEKHLPVVKRQGDVVTVVVGSVAHPMTPEHSIEWVALTDGQDILVKRLSSDGEPVARFDAKNLSDQPLTAYEYCNLHGLWKSEQ